jgi:ribosomal-protein-serine acetyltransferase
VDVLLETRLPGEVRLRSLTRADGAAFAAHVAADLDRLSEFLPWPAATDTVEGATEWVGRYDDREDGRELVAGVFRDGVLVGGVVLFHHDPDSAALELGCWAVAAVEGQGLVRAACVEALRIARVDLRAERVAWQCDTRNTRSRRLAERLGFVHEGTLRSAYVLRGDRTDTDLFSLVGAELDAAIG